MLSRSASPSTAGVGGCLLLGLHMGSGTCARGHALPISPGCAWAHCFFHPSQGCPPLRLTRWERGGGRQSRWGRAGTHMRLLCPQVGEVGSGAARARGRCVGGTLHLCREGGVSTTPRAVPRAQPLHAPPSDATLHMPSRMLHLDFTHTQIHWTASFLFSLPHTEAHVRYDL